MGALCSVVTTCRCFFSAFSLHSVRFETVLCGDFVPFMRWRSFYSWNFLSDLVGFEIRTFLVPKITFSYWNDRLLLVCPLFKSTWYFTISQKWRCSNCFKVKRWFEKINCTLLVLSWTYLKQNWTVLTRRLFKNGIEMRIKDVPNDKSQSAKTSASMGTEPITVLPRREITTTAPPPQRAPLLMAAPSTQRSAHRLISARNCSR